MRDPLMSDAPVPLSNPKVLLIEDNPAVAETLQRFIERSGMRTAWAQTGAAAIELKRSFAPDVVLVDLELPDTNGVSLIGWLSQMQDCGIIVVSGRGEESERIVGLELGADDYIAKPPQLREMVARIRAVHRRSQGRGPARVVAPPVQTVFTAGEFRIDTTRHAVIGPDGQNVALTAAEFTALQTLLEASNQPVSRERLSEAALRRPWRAEDRSIDQLIFSLRRKLGDGERGQRMIQSVRGAGYILIPDAASAPEADFEGK